MQRHASSLTSLALLATFSLSACTGENERPEILDELAAEDPALDVDGFPVVDIEDFEALAPADFQSGQAPPETHSCNLGLPSHVYAGPPKSRAVAGQITGIATGVYFMDAVRPNFPWLSYWSIDAGNTTVAALNQPSGLFVASGGTPIEVFLQAPSGATPGMTYELDVRLYTSASQLACTDHITLEIPDCGQVGWWAAGPWPTPWYDYANCYVAPLPALPQGVSAFIWNNGWYVTPTNGSQCAAGVFDGANCYIGSAPNGHTAFFYDDNMYYTL